MLILEGSLRRQAPFPLKNPNALGIKLKEFHLVFLVNSLYGVLEHILIVRKYIQAKKYYVLSLIK